MEPRIEEPVFNLLSFTAEDTSQNIEVVVGALGRQPVGHHRARRAAADDDVVVHGHFLVALLERYHGRRPIGAKPGFRFATLL